MLYLNKPNEIQLKSYGDSILNTVQNAVSNAEMPDAAANFLNKVGIFNILTDTPDKLIEHHNNFMPLLIPGFKDKQYFEYLKARAKPNKKRTHKDLRLIKKYEISKILLKIFDYEAIISNSKAKSYNLAKILNRYTCTYCNRLYTNTIITKAEKGKKVNDKNRITRPQFDHWFAHSVYPILGISFYNLIPSCSVCNSSVKGSDVFKLDTHTHPYLKDEDDTFTFSFIIGDLDEPSVDIVVDEGSKIANHLKAFKTKEVYNSHSGMELSDLLDLKRKYSDNYIHTLFNDTFKSIEIGNEEIYRMVFGIESTEDFYHKRPFSKFKHDIMEELMRLD